MTDDFDYNLSRRKALAALGAIGVASAGAGLGTSAYFSDQETFENNRLVAGTLDLKVSWEEHYSDWRGAEQNVDGVRMVENTTDLQVNEVGLPSYDTPILAVREDDTDDDGTPQIEEFMDATLQEQFPDKQTRNQLAELPPGVDPCEALADVPDDLTQPVIGLSDVKPGDFGEVTFDFTICDNPGWVWLTGDLRAASENGLTEPEADDPQEGDGVELLDELQVTVWYDDGDNILEETETYVTQRSVDDQGNPSSSAVALTGDQRIVTQGTLREVLAALSTGPGILLDGIPHDIQRDCFAPTPTIHYVGVSWALPVDHANEIQTDTVEFDLGFYTEQCRHNPVGEEIRLERVATGLTAPNWGTAVPGCLTDRLVVTDQDGLVWTVNLTTGDKSVLLDVSDRLVALGVAGPGTFDERGLLGVAFHPEFADNGLLYTYTSEPVSGDADFSTMPSDESANHQSVLAEWRIPEPCSPSSVVDPTTRRELLRIDQPQFNHNAGCLVFGPDGELYVSLGDGGAADDQGIGHVPGGNGQAPSNILGTILRITPTGSNSSNGEYGIPADNPFVGMSEFRDEIFAFGFRNPFRFSFDSATGEMYIADVGQNDIEEIDLGVAGGNYGWRLKEGNLCFDPNGDDPGFAVECDPGDVPAELIDPIAQYDHDEGIAIVGGFVYRGSNLPSLAGRYIFGDYFHPASGSGRLFHLTEANQIQEFRFAERDTLGLSVLGFGQDATGEVYLLANETGVPFGDTGVVLRITSP